MSGSRSRLRISLGFSRGWPRLRHPLQGFGLLLFSALPTSCGSQGFAVGDGPNCQQGTLDCFCDAANACEAPLICQADLCVSPKAPEASTGTSSPAHDPTQPDQSQTSSTTDETTAQCQSDKDCPAPSHPCQQASCQTGVCIEQNLPDKTPCSDNERCVPNGSCKQGLCQGKSARFLAEDFSKGMGDWAMTSPHDQPTQWKIGAAKVSQCDKAGQGEDPAQDHSPGSDNMLAGTNVGGCIPGRTIRAWDCLMSPKMDISDFKGKIELSYWRHLHSPPSVVESFKGARYRVYAVFNGTNPVVVEEGYDAAINDQAWKRSAFLLDADDTSLTVSFCLETGFGAGTFAGWSVDDIRVRAQGCDDGL